MYYVDFNDPKRTRYAKASARAYARIAKTNLVDWSYKPSPEIHIPMPDENLNESLTNSATVLSSVITILYANVSVTILLYFNKKLE